MTSGYSSVFPGGIYLGKIKSSNKDLGSQNQRIKVDLNIDFSSLNKVYVVENLYKAEIEALNKKNKSLSE
jgi:rod shape-determining protein MreC